MTVTRTTCPYCGVGCGVLAQRADDGRISVIGDPDHPANRGRLCSKGTALGATLGGKGRLSQPEVDGVRVDWDTALDAVAQRLQACIDTHGSGSVALYVSGQLLTEDYYVANKLMKGYIGTANIDTNSRLCMSSAVTGHVRAFGEDVVPVEYSDLDAADLVVLVGSNLAWCHPVLMQRILALRELRPGLRLVVIDPRRTATSEAGDLHLPLRSGSDVMLFNGLLVWLAEQGCVDEAWVAAHTTGLDETLRVAAAASTDIAATAQACGLDAALVEKFFAMFAGTERVVTMFSQGVNQSSVGADKVNSIINCHLLTGRIGRSGMGPFSITGQPNAMGGREVGGLSTQLAAHLALDNAAHRNAVQHFWQSPRIADRPGYKATELFETIDAGRIKAVWIMATNPVVSLPDADMVKRALARCPLVIVSDCVDANDTLPFAHIKLPAAAWGEKDGTVTNSDRHISRQRAFLSPPAQAQPDWWIICQVAQRLGFPGGFTFDGPAAIFEEHARMTALSRRFGLQLDLQGVSGLSVSQYDVLEAVQWPVVARGASVRPFADGKFSTVDGRARFIPVAARGPRHATTTEYPLILNTGRIRDQWHTMTRTARATALNAHEPEPYVDANPSDLAAAGIAPGSLLRVVTRWGTALARARASGDLPAGMIFMPIHWNDQFAGHARVGAVVNPVVDPLSGEPEFKHTPARMEAVVTQWQGFLLSRQRVGPPDAVWWAYSHGDAAHRLEFAGQGTTRPDAAWLKLALPELAHADWIEFDDRATGTYRAALLLNGRLEACLMVAQRALPGRSWLASLFGHAQLDPADRRCILLGKRLDVPDPGPTVCACFAVGANVIRGAVQGGCTTVEAVGRKLKAGSNCGSCRPEIAKLLAASHVHAGEPPLRISAALRG
ncbi:MAG: molybdopterin-dependent oxidoreductase [Steroidobacteraceae bacterium]